jgi:hypothetical protein
VIETGEFNFWWNRCNFKQMPEEKCKWLIDVIVKHESRHYDQWKNIATNTLKSLGESRTPVTLKDLESTEGAVKKFMSVWSDVAHYQCREVEDYSMQIQTGEMPSDFFAERIPMMMWYTQKCEASKWKDEFQPHILRAKEIEKRWKSENPGK